MEVLRGKVPEFCVSPLVGHKQSLPQATWIEQLCAYRMGELTQVYCRSVCVVI